MSDITDRLKELAHAAADQNWGEFSMRVPADHARDADLVLLAASKEITRLRAENTELLTDLDRVLTTLRYLIGIAERGAGRPMAEDETAESFVLGYVKRLEAELAEVLAANTDMQNAFSKEALHVDSLQAELAALRKPDCRACAFYYACVIGQHEICIAGAGFDYARDPVRLYERGEET